MQSKHWTSWHLGAFGTQPVRNPTKHEFEKICSLSNPNSPATENGCLARETDSLEPFIWNVELQDLKETPEAVWSNLSRYFQFHLLYCKNYHRNLNHNRSIFWRETSSESCIFLLQKNHFISLSVLTVPENASN